MPGRAYRTETVAPSSSSFLFISSASAFVTFSFTGVTELNNGTTPRTVKVSTDTGVEFDAVVRIDTPQEIAYYQNGGILHYVLRQLAGVA